MKKIPVRLKKKVITSSYWRGVLSSQCIKSNKVFIGYKQI